jgi:hypothetical protein
MDHSEGTVQSAGASFRLSGQIVRMPMIAPGGIIKLRRMKLFERTTPVSKAWKFCDPLQVHSPHRPLETG